MHATTHATRTRSMACFASRLQAPFALACCSARVRACVRCHHPGDRFLRGAAGADNVAASPGRRFRRQKELEEARKAGLAPAALDEDGKEINPHIPEYMTTAPWYLNKDQPTLTHQRNWNKQEEDGFRWYDRGAKAFQATKFRKGACENCGSMSHKTKDCLERPRNKGAKYTNKNIAADDRVQELKLSSYEAKRDRWNGFDANEYKKASHMSMKGMVHGHMFMKVDGGCMGIHVHVGGKVARACVHEGGWGLHGRTCPCRGEGCMGICP
eukprot:365647-Chlamydomonas_euryale.AAC.19